MAEIYDNKTKETLLVEGLRNFITGTAVNRVDFCVGYFNLRGWKLIGDLVDQLCGDYVYENDKKLHRTCRVLVGMHHQPEDIIRALYSNDDTLVDNKESQRIRLKIAESFRRQLLLGVPTKEDEEALKLLVEQLRQRKVVVKLSTRWAVHAKLYLAYSPQNRNTPILSLMGSSNLTYSGLKYQGELNVESFDSDQTKKYAAWFEDLWNEKLCLDITDDLVKVIEESWAEKKVSPYNLYLKIAYHLSEDARNGINSYTLSPEFKHDLFDFQQNAVKIVAHHLNNDKRGGAMLGDVVGLGKTITACAVAKIFELDRGGTTLIICPANLQDMWRKYVKKYDLKAEIVSMSKPIDVENARYFRLIIIDESHNLRNGGKRYNNIKQLIEKLDSRVLLLTATPYNKHYSDLANQLRLFISEDQDLGLRPERYIESLGGEQAFMLRHSDTHIRTIGAFEKSQNVEDWNELMKLFLVRRTRSFIKEHFAKTDPEDGRKYLEFADGLRRSKFPDRIPRSIKFKTTPGDQYSRLYSEQMLDLMGELKLPRYGLSHYISDKVAAEAPTETKKELENLSRAGERLMGFCRSTFFKRMDSSGFSFLLSLYRHVLRNCVFIYAIENKRPLPIGDGNAMPEDYSEDTDNDSGGVFGEECRLDPAVDAALQIPTDIETYRRKAQEYYDILAQKNNVKKLDSKYFKRSLRQQLQKDCEILIQMIELCGQWNQNEDQKLNELEQLLSGTDEKYTEHGNDKVVIFTQYSDTAKYIYNQLVKRGFKNVDIATGDSENPTAIVEKFSPRSNEKEMPASEETRILVATDVLSEGQNLQDAHVIVNYDLPWAIIRLIQRAGRVDRIGQTAKDIYCYSFFPADGIEEIINLRGRLNDRINANANIVGSDEVFFEGNQQNLKDMFNEKSGVLDDADDADVDLASQAFQIWSAAIKRDKRLKEIIPNLQNMIYSTKEVFGDMPEGVITYARTANDFDILTWLDKNGRVISRSQQRILQALACEPGTERLEPLPNHHELVTEAIEQIKERANNNMGGKLGTRLSPRRRIVELLNNIIEEGENLFVQSDRKEELKLVINEIYNQPLKESAKTELGRMLRNTPRGSEQEIVEYVLELWHNDELCNVIEDNPDKEDKIICSMGLKKESNEEN